MDLAPQTEMHFIPTPMRQLTVDFARRMGRSAIVRTGNNKQAFPIFTLLSLLSSPSHDSPSIPQRPRPHHTCPIQAVSKMSSLKSLALFALATGYATIAAADVSGSGTTTRYWDCCKGSCSWTGKADVSNPVTTCNIDDQALTDYSAASELQWWVGLHVLSLPPGLSTAPLRMASLLSPSQVVVRAPGAVLATN
jgi:hypothetical protein